MSRPHITFDQDLDDYYDYEDEPDVEPYKPVRFKRPIQRQTRGAPTRKAITYETPTRKRIVRPKPTFNGKVFSVPEDGTKSQRKIFQTSILKEAYKLIQDSDPRLKGKAGAKLRLKICNQAMKAFKSVYEDPNFMDFIQDPESCQSLIQDFAAELSAQLDNA